MAMYKGTKQCCNRQLDMPHYNYQLVHITRHPNEPGHNMLHSIVIQPSVGPGMLPLADLLPRTATAVNDRGCFISRTLLHSLWMGS